MTNPEHPSALPAPTPLVKEIMTLMERMQQGRQDHNERHWLLQHCGSTVLATLLEELTSLALDVVEAVGRLQPVNGITVARRLDVPKGSVSKAARKLLGQKLLRLEFLPNNKKEVLYCLTPLGEELFALHQTMRRHKEAGVCRFFTRYSDEELQLIARFLREGLAASWLEPAPPDAEGG